MYCDTFGLNDEPFRLAPDPEFLYLSRGHGRARAYLDYSLVSREGFVIITGEIGSGKTLMLRHLLADLPEDHCLIHIEQTQLTPVEFLQRIALELSGEVMDSDNKIDLLERVHVLLNQAWDRELRVVVAVDEAQALSRDVLEEIRMLVGSQVRGERLLTVILLGQPELDRMLGRPDMEQLRQRVRLRFHLDGLARDEIGPYIHRRLEVAGAKDPDALMGGSEILDRIFAHTRGIPRLINTLCEMALLIACIDGKRGVDTEVIAAAIGELHWQANPVSGQEGKSASADPATGDATLESLERVAATLDQLNENLQRVADALDRRVVPLPQRRSGS